VRFAEYLNKRIFSARIGPLDGEDPTRERQQIDLIGDGPSPKSTWKLPGIEPRTHCQCDRSR